MNKFVVISKDLRGEAASGIQRNTYEILKCVDRMILPEEVDLLIPAWEKDNYEFNNIGVKRIGVDIRRFGNVGNRIKNYLYKNFFSLIYVKKNHGIAIDMLLLMPQFGCDAITIYDCIPELFPSHYTTETEKTIRNKRLKNQRHAVKKAKIILTDSESAKTDISRFYDVSKKPIYVVPCGWQHFNDIKEDESILERLGVSKGEYFFSLGSRLPHKNSKWISCAARMNPNYKFVLSGSTPKEQLGRQDSLGADNEIYAGRLSDEEVKALMRNCRAFIQPSMYEGFGIPPMEAMSVGADCIVSNVASLPEVYKKSVWYIDPYDYENIDLDEIMARPKEGNEVILNEYSWEKSAKIFLQILRGMATDK